MRNIFFIYLIFFSCSIKGQIPEQFIETREFGDRAISLVSNDSEPKFVYSISDRSFLVVVRSTDSIFTENFIIYDENTDTVKLKDSKIVYKALWANAFDTDQYHQEYITTQSDFYKEGYTATNEAFSYFCFIDSNGDRYGELCVPTVINPTPLNVDFYVELIRSIMFYLDRIYD